MFFTTVRLFWCNVVDIVKACCNIFSITKYKERQFVKYLILAIRTDCTSFIRKDCSDGAYDSLFHIWVPRYQDKELCVVFYPNNEEVRVTVVLHTDDSVEIVTVIHEKEHLIQLDSTDPFIADWKAIFNEESVQYNQKYPYSQLTSHFKDLIRNRGTFVRK